MSKRCNCGREVPSSFNHRDIQRMRLIERRYGGRYCTEGGHNIAVGIVKALPRVTSRGNKRPREKA